MRVSYNWLKEYLPTDLAVEEIAVILTALGLEVSNVERIESVKGGLKGVVAGKVMTCEKHPNADRLSLTSVDIGSADPLQIVCGAPNVAVGQTVWVATVGTILYPAGSENPLTITKAKVRGEYSEGMICAEDELGLGADHAGIMVLPDGITAGTQASEYYVVTSDDAIDIDLTPNRSDAICHLGVARDLAAWISVNKAPVKLKLPVIREQLQKSTDYPITVEVRNPEACPRYCGVTVTGITIKESPKWLQDRLHAIDVKPINNVVDITNFVLHEMGQPLHAFDADKIKGRKIIVQTLPGGTAFVTLDQVDRKLSGEDLMICDGEGKGMCIAGVYGGFGTGISENTTNIFLESAHFHPGWVRRTSMKHDLHTEAAKTFEKTTDPNACRDALVRAVELILKMAGGIVGSEIIDEYPVPISPARVPVRWEMIRKLSGTDMPREQVLRIFEALDMPVVTDDGTTITIAVPTNKADVTREADVIEEILRIYGYDNVMIDPKMEIPLKRSASGSLAALRDSLGNFLSAQGFFEMMGMSLVESRVYQEGLLKVPEDARILIDNTSNVHLDMMRHNMLSTALEVVRFNQNRMQSDLMLFEFGRVYIRKDAQLHEEERLTLAISGSPLKSGWRGKDMPSDFFFLKKYVHLVLDFLGIVPDEVRESPAPQWDYALEYRRDGQQIVSYGKVNQSLGQQHELKSPMLFADFSLEALLSLSINEKHQVTDIPRFPAVRRDIAIILSRDVSYSLVEASILRAGDQLLTDLSLFDVYENPEAIGTDKRSLAIALTFQDPERTLTDADVLKAMQQIVSALEKEAGATLR